MKKNKTPKVSVVMSCYNAEAYLKLAIDSILNQTFSDFEFIIWNDGSVDTTEEIIKSYTDKRIRYFYHENTGLGIALHLACREATGEYIARMDADDVALPCRFQKEVDFLDKNKDYILVSSAVNYVNEEGRLLGRSFPYTWDKIIRGIVYHYSVIVHPAVMYRKEIYDNAGGYLDIGGSEDRILWGRMKKYGKYANINEPLLNYRVLANSLSHFTKGDPYAPLLELLRYKIASSDAIDKQDIELHNHIFNLIRTNRKSLKTAKTITVHSESLNKVYLFFAQIIGARFAYSTILFWKNCLGIIKFRKLISKNI